MQITQVMIFHKIFYTSLSTSWVSCKTNFPTSLRCLYTGTHQYYYNKNIGYLGCLLFMMTETVYVTNNIYITLFIYIFYIVHI